jgi:hypothetical protein
MLGRWYYPTFRFYCASRSHWKFKESIVFRSDVQALDKSLFLWILALAVLLLWSSRILGVMRRMFAAASTFLTGQREVRINEKIIIMYLERLHFKSLSPVDLPYPHITARLRSLCSSMKPRASGEQHQHKALFLCACNQPTVAKKFRSILYAGMPDRHAATSPVVAELAELFRRVSDRGPHFARNPATSTLLSSVDTLNVSESSQTP